MTKNDNGDDGIWRVIAEEVHRDADRLFKIIGEAYAVLSDPAKVFYLFSNNKVDEMIALYSFTNVGSQWLQLFHGAYVMHRHGTVPVMGQVLLRDMTI